MQHHFQEELDQQVIMTLCLNFLNLQLQKDQMLRQSLHCTDLANGQIIQGTTAHTNLADWLIYKKIAMLPPRSHVNACIAALILDRTVLKRAFVPFFDKVPSDHRVEMLAVGVAKPIERVPQTRTICRWCRGTRACASEPAKSADRPIVYSCIYEISPTRNSPA